MLILYNTLGKQRESFEPVNESVVNIFTCGPSVYQRPHIGNHRTFLFEDILVRYLEYCGYHVRRGMNITDIEDKAIEEAARSGLSVTKLTDENIEHFTDEMNLLKMKKPTHLARASNAVDSAVRIIEKLFERGNAYRYEGNIYFDPLSYPGFGKLYGLDTTDWPEKRRRFHKDTYPGMRWNKGDFIIWHGCEDGGDEGVCWDTLIGTGRPSWNIQDPSIISSYVTESLSLYCGGVDNLIRHHDYTLAILESIRPYPMARYWLHCAHLTVNGKKMSKSTGNVYYVSDLVERGYTPEEIRFFLIYGWYRRKVNYTDNAMASTATRLRDLREKVARLRAVPGADESGTTATKVSYNLREVFERHMNDDLDVKGAVDALDRVIADALDQKLENDAAAVITALRDIDSVLQVLF